jgi:hypothetical protein
MVIDGVGIGLQGATSIGPVAGRAHDGAGPVSGQPAPASEAQPRNDSDPAVTTVDDTAGTDEDCPQDGSSADQPSDTAS